MTTALASIRESITAAGIPFRDDLGDVDSVDAYAWALFDQLSADKQKRWQLKLVYPAIEDTHAAEALLANGQGQGFKALVETLDQPVTRLVTLHLFNALIANGVAFENARTVNMAAWGATSDFFTRTVPFSLVPLTSAYCPREIHEIFPTAFTALVETKLSAVRHSQVRDRLAGLIREIAR